MLITRQRRRHQTEKHVCTPEEFTCKSSEGECIPMSWVCDGNQDCSNGSDETTCSECFFFSPFMSLFVAISVAVIVKKSLSPLDVMLFHFQFEEFLSILREYPENSSMCTCWKFICFCFILPRKKIRSNLPCR